MLFLAGCSTNYHQKGFFGDGYSDYRINQDKFAVTFRGNEYTDSENVRRFAMMRAAELTVQNGFHYFKIVSEKDVSHESIKTSTTEQDDRVITRKEKQEAPAEPAAPIAKSQPWFFQRWAKNLPVKVDGKSALDVLLFGGAVYAVVYHGKDLSNGLDKMIPSEKEIMEMMQQQGPGGPPMM